MKRLIAFVLALGMLLSLCACGKTPAEESQPETVPAETVEETTAATEEPTEPENLTYAEEHGFQFVGASDLMDYQYPSSMYCSGLTDVEFDPDVWNSSTFRLVSAEPLTDDPNYTVYTFTGVHTCAIKLSGMAVDGASWGVHGTDLVFVDANTGYKLFREDPTYADDNNHHESSTDISSEGLLASPGFQWNGKEIHISSSYSGDSYDLYNDCYVGDDGRNIVDFSAQVEEKYVLAMPTGYTGLCVGVAVPKSKNDPNYVESEENAEAGNKLELFEPDEDYYYYFRRLDEMAALLNDGVISGRTESGALTKSIQNDREDLDSIPNIAANSDGTVQKFRDGTISAQWTNLLAEPEETANTLREKGIEDITVAAYVQEASDELEALQGNMCSVDIINRSKGLLVEVVAFDGECNVIGRSGIVGPQEFLSGFPLDKIPETTFLSTYSGMFYQDGTSGSWVTSEEPALTYNVTFGAYVYDLDGNFLYYELFAKTYCV
jgi:lipoprotein